MLINAIKCKKCGDVSKEQLEEFISKNMSSGDISKHLNIPYHTVIRRLNKYNLKCLNKNNSFNNLLNLKFGKLRVIKKLNNRRDRHIMWLCRCECGNEKEICSADLICGRTKSCGCLKIEACRKNGLANKKDFKISDTRLYRIFHSMKQRCLNIKDKNYYNYGGRGISIYKKWLDNFQSFYDWANENGYSENLTIDRIDNDGNYEPSNCRWATNKQQQNNRRNNHYVEYLNETKTLTEWCEFLNIDYSLICNRILSGWSFERAVSTIKGRYIVNED